MHRRHQAPIRGRGDRTFRRSPATLRRLRRKVCEPFANLCGAFAKVRGTPADVCTGLKEVRERPAKLRDATAGACTGRKEIREPIAKLRGAVAEVRERFKELPQPSADLQAGRPMLGGSRFPGG